MGRALQEIKLKNGVIAAPSVADSIRPDFMRGSSLSLTVSEGVVYRANSAERRSSSVNVTVLTAPTADNTALVNMAGLSGDLYTGEDDVDLIIDTAGAEVTALVGQNVAFMTPTGEITYGLLKSSTELSCFRGYAFSPSGVPIERASLSDDDTLTLLKTGHVFIDKDGGLVVSYRTPVESTIAPTSAVTGDFWLDIDNDVWKQLTTSWIDNGYCYLGEVFVSGTEIVGVRCVDLARNYSDLNNLELEIESTEVVKTKSPRALVSVYGREFSVKHSFIKWDITTDLETGLTEAADKVYYLYLTEKGYSVISDEKPYWKEDMGGDYHPYNSWRLIGMAYNDASSDLINSLYFEKQEYIGATSSSGTFTSSSSTYSVAPNQTFYLLNRKPCLIKATPLSVDLGFGGQAFSQSGADGGPKGNETFIGYFINGDQQSETRYFSNHTYDSYGFWYSYQYGSHVLKCGPGLNVIELKHKKTFESSTNFASLNNKFIRIKGV